MIRNLIKEDLKEISELNTIPNNIIDYEDIIDYSKSFIDVERGNNIVGFMVLAYVKNKELPSLFRYEETPESFPQLVGVFDNSDEHISLQAIYEKVNNTLHRKWYCQNIWCKQFPNCENVLGVLFPTYMTNNKEKLISL